jgi:NAD(P)-dependent dehydrogenase (short-subunit alcohol dehydrogenase family)
MELDGRVAVITGATGGLGRVVARAFAERGASLVLVSSNQARLDALVSELGLPVERRLTHVADLRDPAAAHSVAQAVSSKFGRAHILLHLVGGWVGGKDVGATSADELKSMLDQHVWTTFHLLQAFVPQLTVSGWGRIIVVSSPVAAHATARMSAYAAAKAAEEALLLTLAQETKDKGVTANILQVRTIDAGHKREKEPSPSHATWTTPEEIAAAMLYLCSAEAAMVSAARIPLFGA